MLTEYIGAAMKQAIYTQLEDGSYFGSISTVPGVWAQAETEEACAEELREVLEDWILLGLRQGHPLPVIDEIDLNISTAPISA